MCTAMHALNPVLRETGPPTATEETVAAANPGRVFLLLCLFSVE